MANNITFTLHIDDGTNRELKELTAAEREKMLEHARERGSAALSSYYTQHPAQFAGL